MNEARTRESQPTGRDGAGSTAASGQARSVRVWQVMVAVVVLLALAAATWVVVERRRGTEEQASTASTGVATQSASPTTTASPAPSGTPGPETGDEAPIRTAALALDGFLARATMADQALREASSRINASITATEVTYDERTFALLASAAPEAVAPTLPAGMPDTLQQAALLVYSDLVSRWAAMSGQCNQGVGTFPRILFDGCFTQGGPAAARFAGDLAALEQRAEATPEFTGAGQDSRAAEELAVRVRFIDMADLGCGSTGGFVATDPIPLVWQDIPDDRVDVGGPDWQGTVGDIPFRGTFDPALGRRIAPLGWDIEIFAC